MMAAPLAEGLRVSRRVAVVGGGSAGVAAARFLKQAGHKPNVFETGASFGVWAEAPTNSVVYKNLRTNLPKQVMQSPDLDFPSALPSYVDGRALGDDISTYAGEVQGRGDLSAREVLDVTPLPGDRWRGKVRNATKAALPTNTTPSSRCNGHYAGALRPRDPGAGAHWVNGERSIVHSLHYHEPATLRRCQIGAESSEAEVRAWDDQLGELRERRSVDLRRSKKMCRPRVGFDKEARDTCCRSGASPR